jgi:DNA-binding NtrC family response regulator
VTEVLVLLLASILWIVDADVFARGRLAPDPAAFAVTMAHTHEEALGHAAASEFDVVLIAVSPADASPDLLIEDILRTRAQAPIVIHAPQATLADAVRWTKLGAHQVLQDEDDLFYALRTACSSRQLFNLAASVAGPKAPAWRSLMIGRSQKMHHMAEIIRLVAPRRCTVLITGETGTGKDVVARCIHAASNRTQYQMVSVNCSALPENLLEAELFGHVRGAFTGANTMRVGRFEQAQHGTLFFDEIGDMPLPLQAKLLRVLQEREFQRLGSSETIRIDVRVIAATNVNLLEKVQDGSFREDLYYRLNVVPIAVPPLRDRPTDVPVLAGHFVEKICRYEGFPTKHIPGEVMDRLQTHDWPGNVRQLENAVEMALALSGERTILYPSDFPLPARARFVTADAGHHHVALPDHGLDFERTMGGIELNILEQALHKTGGNKKMAADMLGLKRTTLAAKLKSLSEMMAGAATLSTP